MVAGDDTRGLSLAGGRRTICFSARVGRPSRRQRRGSLVRMAPHCCASAGFMWTRVGQDDESVSGRSAVEERQVKAWAVVAEQLLAFAEDDGMEPELIFVDEVVFDQRLHQLGAAQDEDRLSGLLL